MKKPCTANAILPEEVRSELDLILASGTFRAAHRLRSLLEFLGERYLQSAPAPKEYEIATLVFERPDSFDPTNDSLVRVHASRLRAKLREYYGQQSGERRFEIQLARSSYQLEVVPLVELDRPAEKPVAELPEPSPSPLPSLPGPVAHPSGQGWLRRHHALQAGGLATCVMLFAGMELFRRPPEPDHPVRLTRIGATAGTAKFSHDGKRILFSFRPAVQAGLKLHSLEVGSRAEPVAVGYEGLKLFSVSEAGLLFLDSQSQYWIAPELGSPAKKMDGRVVTARWDRKKGNPNLLTVRESEGGRSHVLEYPQGNVLASHPRNLGNPFEFAMPSRDGRWVAYGKPSGKSTDYDLWVLDTRDRSAKVVMAGWIDMGPIAFSASGEIVVGGLRRGQEPTIYRIQPSTGKSRVARVFSHMTIVEDIRDDDSMIIREIVKSRRIIARLPGQATEGNLPLEGEFTAVALSPNGKRLIVAAVSPRDSENQELFLYDIEAPSKLVPVGAGTHASFSADGTQLLVARVIDHRGHAIAIDLSTLAARDISLPGYSYLYPDWSSAKDGAFLFLSENKGGPTDSYFQDNKKTAHRIDARLVCMLGADTFALQKGDELSTWKLSDGVEKVIGRKALEGLILARYLPSSGTLLAQERAVLGRYFAIDQATGNRTLWKRLGTGAAEDRLVAPNGVFSSDGEFYAFTVERDSRSLFLIPSRR